jgi:2-keto-3-deoxygluconate permease
MRKFLSSGEGLLIPFFAFALGTTMNLGTFLKTDVLAGGLFLGVATVVVTGPLAALALRLFGERSTIAGIAEASTAGNAVQTPQLVAAAAAGAVGLGMTAAQAAEYERIVPLATGQISISTMVTAVLCPIAVILWDRWQRTRGIDARTEYGDAASSTSDLP